MKNSTIPDTMKLVILQTSDLHGAVYPHSYVEHQPQDIGLAKIATWVKKVRSQISHVLLVDNGDAIQGSPLTYHHAKIDPDKANPVISCMNTLQYDAAVIGNHEFNYGLPYLKRAIGQSEFPWLSANLIRQSTGEPFFGSPYRIWQFPGGLKVALLGLTTAYIPNWELPEHLAGIEFLNPVEAARHWVEFLKNEQMADFIILSYHGGLERDLTTGQPCEPLTGENQGYALCEEVAGFDVLLTGHQHRMLEGEINGVLVVQPGSHGTALAQINVDLYKTEERWIVEHKSAQLLSVGQIPADEEIMKPASDHEADTQAWLDTPIGWIDGNMKLSDPKLARLHGHALIEFVNRVQMEASGADISCTALFDDTAPGFSERVTMREIVSNYIYPNTLKVIRVKGSDIKKALEQSAAYFQCDEQGGIAVSPAFLYPKPQHYNYDMWKGIEYTLDISRPLGQRVAALARDGKPLDEEGEYDVVMNNYRAGGGGNYEMFKGKPVVREISTDMVELLADYFLKHRRIPLESGQWEVIRCRDKVHF